MLDDGVNLLARTEIDSLVRGENGGITIMCNNGQKVTDFDTVIWAIGRSPNSATLDLGIAGVSVDSDGFVVTDDYQNTNGKGIYAIGDITNRPALTPVAVAAGLPHYLHFSAETRVYEVGCLLERRFLSNTCLYYCS